MIKLSRFLVILFLVLQTRMVLADTRCAQSVNVNAMTQEWLGYLMRELESGSQNVAILPFSPVLSHSTVPPYFPYAFPILLADYWPPDGSVRAADWRLTNQIMSALRIQPTQAFDDAAAIAVGERLKVRYVIAGAFDLSQSAVKIYVRYYDVPAKRRIDAASLTLKANLDASFLLMIGDIVKGANAAFGRMGVDQASFRVLTHFPRRYEAVRDYVQGVANTGVYDSNYLSVAQVWLKSAIGKDYQFYQAYRELARAHLMLALIAKQRLLNPALGYLEAEKVLRQAELYTQGAPLFPTRSLARYLDSQSDFAVAANFFNQRQYDRALSLFQKVRNVLPEDGLNQYYLGLTYQNIGQTMSLPAIPSSNQSSAKAIEKTQSQQALAQAPMTAALQINSCFTEVILK